MDNRSVLAATMLVTASSAWAADPPQTTYENQAYRGVLGVVVDPKFRLNAEVTAFKASLDVKCKDLPKAAVGTLLPKFTEIRVSPESDLADKEAWRVFVYSVPDVKGVGEKAIEVEYFKEPFVICRTGNFFVRDDLMRRDGGFNTGVLVVPFKLRRGDIFGDATVGPYVSYHVDRFELLGSAGLTQISTVDVAGGEIKNESGLTLALGLKFQIKKDWDIAFVIGADHLSGDVGRAWKFQNKPWVSFAVGVALTK